MICEKCGAPLEIGTFPFCPHGEINAGRGADVTWPGGKTFENLGNEPLTFYSKSEYQRHLKTHGIEEFVRHQPVPGSDKSPHTVSWAAVSQETLDGAKAMLERVSKTTTAPPAETYIKSMTVTVTDVPGYITTPITGIHDAS